MNKPKNKKGRPKFTKQLSKALKHLTNTEPKLLTTKSANLFSPVYISGKYEWITLVATDGLLVSERLIGKGTPQARTILVGVIIQSEQATSQTKPNPLGKAAAVMTPLGLWVDLKRDKVESRERLDVVKTFLVVPKPSDAKRKVKHAAVWQNVKNVADTVDHASMLELNQGDSSDKIAQKVMDESRRFLLGKGRPRKK